MNKAQLEQRLNNEQPEMASVSENLHRRVMQAVASASTARESSWSFGFGPALAAGAMAAVAVVLIWTNFNQSPVPGTPASVVVANDAPAGVEKINRHFASLSIEVSLPEAALRKELQRLEADLKRFRLSS